MLSGSKVAVVVPAFNESRLIGRTLGSMPGFVDVVVVVDDGSTDDTLAVTERLKLPHVIALRHATNQGVGAAIATGYAAALRQRVDLIAVMAGDAQMDPNDLERLLRPLLLGEADYAKGDRLSHPAARRQMPLARWLGNHTLSTLTRWATGMRVRDSQCGYTAMTQGLAARLPLDKLWPRYGYPNDLLGQLAEHGARVTDVVVRPIYADEQSGIGWRHALVVIPFVLCRVVWRRLMTTRALRPVLTRR